MSLDHRQGSGSCLRDRAPTLAIAVVSVRDRSHARRAPISEVAFASKPILYLAQQTYLLVLVDVAHELAVSCVFEVAEIEAARDLRRLQMLLAQVSLHARIALNVYEVRSDFVVVLPVRALLQLITGGGQLLWQWHVLMFRELLGRLNLVRRDGGTARISAELRQALMACTNMGNATALVFWQTLS